MKTSKTIPIRTPRTPNSESHTRISVKTRLIMLGVLAAMVGLVFAGYTLDPSRRGRKWFSWGNTAQSPDLKRCWESIIHMNGCLVGQHNYHDGKIGEGSILNDAIFQPVLHGNREEVGRFLVNQMPSQHETNIHTCPEANAKEGELAIYILQHVTHTNWFEYRGTHPTLREYIQIREEMAQGKRPYDAQYSDQQLLWKIIANAEMLRELQQYYMSVLQKK